MEPCVASPLSFVVHMRFLLEFAVHITSDGAVSAKVGGNDKVECGRAADGGRITATLNSESKLECSLNGKVLYTSTSEVTLHKGLVHLRLGCLSRGPCVESLAWIMHDVAAELRQKETDLQREKAEIHDFRERQAEHCRALAEVQVQVDKEKAESHRLKQRLENVVAELHAEKLAHGQCRATAAELRAALQSKTAEVDNLHGTEEQNKTLHHRLQMTIRKLATQTAENDTLRQRLEQIEAESHAVSQRLEAVKAEKLASDQHRVEIRADLEKQKALNAVNNDLFKHLQRTADTLGKRVEKFKARQLEGEKRVFEALLNNASRRSAENRRMPSHNCSLAEASPCMVQAESASHCESDAADEGLQGQAQSRRNGIKNCALNSMTEDSGEVHAEPLSARAG